MTFSQKLFIVLLSIAIPGQLLALEWSPAPLACLPDRAVRWELPKEMEPCHCPSQDMCPDEPNLTAENIVFLVEWDGVPGRIEDGSGRLGGMSVPELASGAVTIPELFAFTTDQIRELLWDPLKDAFGVSIKGRGAQENIYSADITIELAAGAGGDIADWLNNTLSMPVSMAQQCCDSICPEGLTPEISETTVTNPRPQDEGVSLNPITAAALRGEIEPFAEELLKTIEELREKDTEEDDAQAEKLVPIWDIIDCIAQYLKEIEERGIYDELIAETIKHFEDLYETLDKDLTPEIAEEYTTQVDLLDGMYRELLEERAIRERPKTIVIEQFQCVASDFHFLREGCLTKGTKITMADKSTKNIEDIVLGDMIWGNHGPAKVIAHSVFTQNTDHMYSINGGKAFFTVEHPVLTTKGWKSMDQSITSIKSDATLTGTLREGDVIMLAEEGRMKVESIEEVKVEGGVSAYNLSVEGDGSFIANGFIMKGFKQMQMHY